MTEARPAPALAEATFRKVALRLLPFLGLCYLAAYLDRVNVGFAKLQMARELGLSDAAYGLGAGVFFAGYFLFETPSNLVLRRVGAKLWLARIMVTWGCISAAMGALAWVKAEAGPEGARYAFYGLRFLLGSAEAGFFPGVLFYLTYWFPQSRQSLALALFILAQPLAFIVGAPLSGLVMDRLDGISGLRGWEWMYLVEAAPAVVLGIWLAFRLDRKVADARWLTPTEQDLVQAAVAQEAPPGRASSLRALAADPLAWRLALAYFMLNLGAYGVNFWLPSIVKAAGVTGNFAIGLVTAAPYLTAVAVMLGFGALTPHPKTAKLRAAFLLAVGGAGLAVSASFPASFLTMMAGLAVGVSGYIAATALFWSLPNSAFDGRAAAAGIAAINSLGNVGGFVGPYVVGALSDHFAGPRAGLYFLAAAMATGGLVLVTTRLDRR